MTTSGRPPASPSSRTSSICWPLDHLNRWRTCDSTSPATLLSAVERQLPDGSYQSIDRPLTALRDSTLLVNAPGEPRVLHELIAEVPSAHSIDVLVAFVRLSGINPMLTALRRHLENGGRVRLLTTTYTNSTQVEALEALTNAGADVRVSYDQTTTRLHAKAWIFNRARGQSTAYVGSSNLTHSAMVPGLEWNVRLSSSRNPDVIAKMSAVFETYWSSGDFEPFETNEFRERTAQPENRSTSAIPPTDLTLRPFQERMLERIAVARAHGHHRNLLVAATGTGKTVMAAVDYRNLSGDAASCPAAVRRPSPRDSRTESPHLPPCTARRVLR